MSKEKLNKKNQNYTIESLEPRYMMSADAPIDLSDNNAVDNQLSAQNSGYKIEALEPRLLMDA